MAAAKSKGRNMATNHANKFGDRVKGSLEQAQSRLASLEEEAQKVVAASRNQVSQLLQKFTPPELLDPKHLKDLTAEWTGKAQHVGEDLSNRLDELRVRAIAFMGVASREQVEELARDVEKLSRKLDRLVAVRKPATRVRAE